MSDIELGPVDYLIVEWPPGKEPTGEGLEQLVDLTERGLIRVIDLAFVKKEEDGSVAGLAITDLDADGSLDLVQFRGASSGVLGQEDYNEAGAAREPGTSAAILGTRTDGRRRSPLPCGRARRSSSRAGGSPSTRSWRSSTSSRSEELANDRRGKAPCQDFCVELLERR